MAEEINVQGSTREEIYTSIFPQLEAVLLGEDDLIANLANTSAILKQAFGFFWVGFYIVKENELVLGPFQGPLACTRIQKGKGVCGQSWEQSETLLVPDVDAFPGHIACSSLSKSEIVVPITSNGKVVAVLDVDSDKINDFSPVDESSLQKIALLIAQICFKN